MKKHWLLASHTYLLQKDVDAAEKLTAEALEKYITSKINSVGNAIPTKAALREFATKLCNRKNCDVNRLVEIYCNFKQSMN